MGWQKVEPPVPQATFPGLIGSDLTAAVEHCLPDYVYKLLVQMPELFIAGGFIRDASVRVPYKDIDIYCNGREPAVAYAVLRAHGAQVSVDFHGERGITALCEVTGPNTNGTGIIWGQRQVQLLHSGPRAETLTSFDLCNCMAAYGGTGHYGKVTAFQEFLLAVQSGISGANPTAINSHTYARMRKMELVGWEFEHAARTRAMELHNPYGKDSG